jgi:hypothetical protein
MDKFLYQCQYCGKEYKPNRRHKQIFCSNSCRTNSHIRNKKSRLAVSADKLESQKPTQIEKPSLAGITNATAGALLADGIIHVVKTFVIKDEDKPVTKKDMTELIKTLKGRYFPIKNAPIRADGAKPFYDIQTQNYVYFKN